MRFPRNARVFRGQLDASPFVGVMFLLLIFFLLNSALVFTPGVPLELPKSEGWAGPTNPTVTVAVDSAGELYFQNQLTTEQELETQLANVVRQQQPLTMVLLTDRRVPSETIIRLVALGRRLGIQEAWLATRPLPDPSMPAEFP
ncbi:MAG: biopolymer transporter ExbD [Verrucomicrobia bacterium]|jgi:biopolymer transport protein ExbD|nr:biopolymer transporter ExbD [Verrucomicrobiota bacterium]